MTELDGLQFPYMFWAHEESFRSPYCLAQSGMPVPESSWLGALEGDAVLGHPSADALPRLEKRLGECFGVDPSRVVVTPGATGAMLTCALRWFRPGSHVASERPAYEPLRKLASYLGAKDVACTRRLEDGWRLDPDRYAAALAGARPGHALVTNPHNPSGSVSGKRELGGIAAACAEAGGVLVSCEAYMEYGTPEERMHAALLFPNAVSIGTLTKAYGLGALRIGWILLGADLVDERRHLVDMGYLGWIDPPTAALHAARIALDHLPTLLQPLRRIEVESRPHLWRWLEECIEIEAHRPPFGILSFPRVRGVNDTVALQKLLAAEFGVDVVAGEFFGAPGYVRVACGVPEATLVEGLRRLSDGIRVYKERGGA
ncbi:MAG: pyridoxal phosphate-dependent aminotransferase [bacterium]|nr:pyridoxal phosphate-dependent aminotransferase [bacterium]